METLGGVLVVALPAVTVIWLSPTPPRLSVATARMTCVPAVRLLILQVSYGAEYSVLTRRPSRYHCKERMPSASLAVTVQLTAPEVGRDAPLAGRVNVTTGAGLLLVVPPALTVIWLSPTPPRLSVATARMTCDPAGRLLILQVSYGALNSVLTSLPSRYHCSERMPSASVAVTVQPTAPEVGTVAPLAGLVKVTTGAGLVVVPPPLFTLKLTCELLVAPRPSVAVARSVCVPLVR